MTTATAFERRAERGNRSDPVAILAKARAEAWSQQPPWGNELDDSSAKRRRAATAAAVAACIAVVAVGGLVALTVQADDLNIAAGDHTEPPVSTSQQQTTEAPLEDEAEDSTTSFAVPDGYLVPLITMDQPGFAILDGYSSRLSLPEQSGTPDEIWIFRNPALGLDGPALTVRPATARFFVHEGEEIEVNSSPGVRIREGSVEVVQWNAGDDHGEWIIVGWQLSSSDLLAVAESMDFDQSGSPVPGELPAGLEAALRATPPLKTDLTSAEFEFRTDAFRGDLLISSGNLYRYESTILGYQTDSADLRWVSLDSESADPIPVLLAEGRDSTRNVAIWHADTFTFELRLTGGTLDDLEGLVSTIGVADEAAWQQVTPPDWPTAAEHRVQVESILSDIPLPEGFDPMTVVEVVGPGSRYQTVAQVTAKVACRWVEQWADAQSEGNHSLADDAAAAMATASEWDALNEIADHGGWASQVLQYADAINGSGTVIGGDIITVEESYSDALGC